MMAGSFSELASGRAVRMHLAVSIVLLLVGLPLLAGGIWLTTLGGSLYYLLAGATLVAASYLIAQRRSSGIALYAALLLATCVWSLWEGGLAVWSLIPRLTLLLVLAIPVALALPRLNPAAQSAGRAKVAYIALAIAAISLTGLGVFAFVPRHIVAAGTPKPGRANDSADEATDAEWRNYGRTVAGTRFSPLSQITPGNVHRLQVAWVYRMGGSLGPTDAHQTTPLQVGQYLYLCTHRNEVIALDAESGKQRWRFDPQTTSASFQRCRGVAYHAAIERPSASETPCSRRVIFTTVDARLGGLDAQSGRPCADFGEQGFVDLKRGMGVVGRDHYFQTSAPLIAGDLIVVGGLARDFLGVAMPSGVIRAFDATTGALIWAWDSGNPAITGLPPEGQTYTRGSPNMWSTASYDPDLALIYVTLGEPTGAMDFWGGWRSNELERYANSVVALDATTGRPRWHFQTIHHDIWDYDLPPQPTLFDVPDGKGGNVPALIQASKTGQIFLLDRRNGSPIAPVQEKPVPQSGLPDDWTSPTQPYSVGMPAIGTEELTEARMWGLTPFDQLWCRIRFKSMRYEGLFTPPDIKPGLQYPSVYGGMNWGGVAVDERRAYLLVNDIRLPHSFELLPRAEFNEQVAAKKVAMAGHWPIEPLPPEAPYGGHVEPFLSPLGLPCSAPPWGTLTAIDLASRRIVWQIPLGTTRDTPLVGLKHRLPLPMGLPTVGGVLTTRSGLVFFSGTQDFYLRALDVGTGKELWKKRLPVGSQATPMTYRSDLSGRQFVVTVAGGAAQSRERGDYVIAYALPAH